MGLSLNYGGGVVGSSVSSQESSYISNRSDQVVGNGRTFWGFPFTSFEEHRNKTEVILEDNDAIIEENIPNITNLDDDKFNENVGSSGKETELKLCGRGHWRPAEDSKLKELVALYGPQNWNLIAEKLQGRSGNKIKQLGLSFSIISLLRVFSFMFVFGFCLTGLKERAVD